MSVGSPAGIEAVQALGSPQALEIDIAGLAPGAPVEIETLDTEHGNAIAAWHALGDPEPPTREQAEAIRQAAWATGREIVRTDAQGVLRLRRSLAPWSLVLLREVR